MAAESSTSAVVCCVVYWWTADKNSSRRWNRLATWGRSGSSNRSGRSIMSRKSWNCWAEFVVTTKYPSRVGSMDGTSMDRFVPTLSGHPENEANTEG